MLLNKAAKRLKVLNNFLFRTKLTRNNLSSSYSTESVTIGNTTKEIKQALKEEYVPRKYCELNFN